MSPGRIARVLALAATVVLAGSFAASATLAMPAQAADAASTTSTLSSAQVQARQWWIERLNLHRAWRITRGSGVTVAVVDTGVERSFADLRGALVPGFSTGNAPGNGTPDSDDALHGTRIADEIAGRGTGFGLLGVAPQAKILPVDRRDTSTVNGTAATLHRLASMARPPQVVNMSYGIPFACPDEVEAAVRRAVAAGIVLVAAAGNTGDVGGLSLYPANCPGVVAVGAVNRNAQVWSGSQRKAYVSLAGPGVHMIGYDAQASSGFGFSDGTSDSAAMVSGIIALVRARFPSMSPRDVVTRVLATTHQVGGPQGSRNNRSGYGIALPYNALTQRVRAGASNPVYDALNGHSGSGSPSTPPSASGTPTSNSPIPGTSSSGGTVASGGNPAAAQGSGSGGNTGLLVGIVVAVVLVGLVIGLVTVRARRRGVAGYAGPPQGGHGPPPGLR